MKENEITAIIVDVCYHIHCELGPGLFENVYKIIVAYELQNRGLKVECEKSIPAFWKDLQLGTSFKADLLVEDKVMVELKSIENILPVHKKQLTTYIKLSDIKVGLLINFNVDLIKNGITRIVNNFHES